MDICGSPHHFLIIMASERKLFNYLFYVRYPQICETVSHKFETPPEMLISRLSFSHIREIMKIEDPLERFFYEMESIKGTWSVRELRRQIDTKLFIRAGISKNPDLLLDKIESGDINAVLPIKDIFAFEFLGLDAKDLVEESDLEKAIMDNLQTFLLEMGKGFCFEAKFDFSYAAQLNAYVSYYKDCEMTEGDNPPIGILLCTQKGPKMVEYIPPCIPVNDRSL